MSASTSTACAAAASKTQLLFSVRRFGLFPFRMRSKEKYLVLILEPSFSWEDKRKMLFPITAICPRNGNLHVVY